MASVKRDVHIPNVQIARCLPAWGEEGKKRKRYRKLLFELSYRLDQEEDYDREKCFIFEGGLHDEISEALRAIGAEKDYEPLDDYEYGEIMEALDIWYTPPDRHSLDSSGLLYYRDQSHFDDSQICVLRVSVRRRENNDGGGNNQTIVEAN
jgi:hypothetical protein